MDQVSIPTEFERELNDLSKWNQYFRFDAEKSSFVLRNVAGSWNRRNDIAAGLVGDALLLDLQSGRPLVRHLTVTLPCLCTDFAVYQSLLDYVSLAKLESITLDGYWLIFLGYISPLNSSHFLRAIQSNQNVRNLKVIGCSLCNRVWVDFLRHCALDTLEIDCTFETELANSSPMDLVIVAFRENRTLQDVHFNLTDETKSSVLEIFTQLSENKSIRRLSLEWSPISSLPIDMQADYSVDIDTIQAISKLIATSSSLRQLHLSDFEFAYIEPLLTALDTNPNINKVTFEQCRWDNASMAVTMYWMGRLRHVKHLHLEFCIPDQRNRDRMEQWRQVLCRNIFYQDVQWTPTCCAPDEEWTQCLLRRNRGIRNFLQQFLDPSPEDSMGPNIPSVLVPHVLARLSDCWHGPTWIFQALSNGRITDE